MANALFGPNQMEAKIITTSNHHHHLSGQ